MQGRGQRRGAYRRSALRARQGERDVADHAVGPEVDVHRALIAAQNLFEEGRSEAALTRWRNRGPAGFDPVDPNTVGKNAPPDEEASLLPGEGAMLRRVRRQFVDHKRHAPGPVRAPERRVSPSVAMRASPSRMLVLKLPRLLLERRVGETRTFTAYHIARFGGEASFTSALLSLLPNHTHGHTPEVVDVIKDYVLDLVALCLRRA